MVNAPRERGGVGEARVVLQRDVLVVREGEREIDLRERARGGDVRDAEPRERRQARGVVVRGRLRGRGEHAQGEEKRRERERVARETEAGGARGPERARAATGNAAPAV